MQRTNNVQGLKKAIVAGVAAMAVIATGRAFAAVTTTLQLTSADPVSGVPTLAYDASAGIVSVTGNFALTGENGVTLSAGQTGPATLTLTGFNPDGAATTPIAGLIQQNLITGAATFTLQDASSNVLLSGTATDAELSLSTGDTAAGSLFSINNVTYNASPIFSDFLAANYTNPGAFSFDLTAFGTGEPTVVGGVLQSFTSSIGGAYAATPVPEPASLCLLAAGIPLFMRRRSRG
jgi:hypothetical protein